MKRFLSIFMLMIVIFSSVSLACEVKVYMVPGVSSSKLFMVESLKDMVEYDIWLSNLEDDCESREPKTLIVDGRAGKTFTTTGSQKICAAVKVSGGSIERCETIYKFTEEPDDQVIDVEDRDDEQVGEESGEEGGVNVSTDDSQTVGSEEDDEEEEGGSSIWPWLLGGAAGLLGLFGLRKLMGNKDKGGEGGSGSGGSSGNGRGSLPGAGGGDFDGVYSGVGEDGCSSNSFSQKECSFIGNVRSNKGLSFDDEFTECVGEKLEMVQPDVEKVTGKKNGKELKDSLKPSADDVKSKVEEFVKGIDDGENLCGIRESGGSYVSDLADGKKEPDAEKWFFKCDDRFCPSSEKSKAADCGEGKCPGPCDDAGKVCNGGEGESNTISAAAVGIDHITGHAVSDNMITGMAVKYYKAGPVIYKVDDGKVFMKQQAEDEWYPYENADLEIIKLYDEVGPDGSDVKDEIVDLTDQGNILGDEMFAIGTIKEGNQVCGTACCELTYGKDFADTKGAYLEYGTGMVEDGCYFKPEGTSEDEDKGCCELVKDWMKEEIDILNNAQGMTLNSQGGPRYAPNQDNSDYKSALYYYNQAKEQCKFIINEMNIRSDKGYTININEYYKEGNDAVKPLLDKARDRCKQTSISCREKSLSCAENAHTKTGEWINSLSKNTDSVYPGEVKGSPPSENLNDWKDAPGCYSKMDKKSINKEQYAGLGDDCAGNMIKMDYINNQAEDLSTSIVPVSDNWLIGEKGIKPVNLAERISKGGMSNPLRYSTLNCDENNNKFSDNDVRRALVDRFNDNDQHYIGALKENENLRISVNQILQEEGIDLNPDVRRALADSARLHEARTKIRT